jgi:rubrerythrin
MSDRITFQDALDLAIGQEQSAVDFYVSMAEQTENPALRDILQLFAREERAHKAKLEFIKSIGEMKHVSENMMEMNPSDYPADAPSYSPEVSVPDTLLWAMKKEKVAFKFFNAFAALAPNDALRTAFSTLALEEANHRIRLEIACDELKESSPET